MQLNNKNVFEKIFVCYDIKQVSDVILLTLFVEKTGNWEKVFLYKKEIGWDTSELRNLIDLDTFKIIRQKLSYIFKQFEEAFDHTIDFAKAHETNSEFMIGVYT